MWGELHINKASWRELGWRTTVGIGLQNQHQPDCDVFWCACCSHAPAPTAAWSLMAGTRLMPAGALVGWHALHMRSWPVHAFTHSCPVLLNLGARQLPLHIHLF